MSRRTTRCFVGLAICALACVLRAEEPPREPGRAIAPHKLATEHLPNVVQETPNVISGGLPADDAAFAELAKLGVKTVISVDGIAPNLEAAHRHGLRYVHLPFGYDGIPDERIAELAKAVHDLPGPIYIHCHHGMHRSPAAAAAGCVTAGLLPPEQADAVLKLAGTSPNYIGLFQAVERARPMRPEAIDALKVDFKELAPIPPLAEAMVAIEHTHDHLRKLASNDWRSLASDPDRDASHEALLLREHFAELLRSDAIKGRPADFMQMLRDEESSARSLEQRLRTSQGSALSPPDLQAIDRQFERLGTNCKTCHERYRDVPRTAKN